MSTSNAVDGAEKLLTEPPTFDLDCAFDDEVDPSLVTIFSDAENEVTTHWISIDIDSAIDIDDIA